MATRRNVPSALDRDVKDVSQPSTSNSSIAPAVPSSVIYTLLSFTFAMVTLPLGTYFFVVNFVFPGSNTWGGALAALMANVVLVAYIVMAMRDDAAEQAEEAEKRRKGE